MGDSCVPGSEHALLTPKGTKGDSVNDYYPLVLCPLQADSLASPQRSLARAETVNLTSSQEALKKCFQTVVSVLRAKTSHLGPPHSSFTCDSSFPVQYLIQHWTKELTPPLSA